MQVLLANHWHHLPVDQVVAFVETDLHRRLDLFDAKHRQERFGPDARTARKGKMMRRGTRRARHTRTERQKGAPWIIS